MTSTISNSSFQSLAPDRVSQTAAILLALKVAGLTRSNSAVSFALIFLEAQSVRNTTHIPFNNQTFASALSSLAFEAFNDVTYSQSAKSFLISLQNGDGGFSDNTRFTYPTSNALDTSWALIALETVQSAPNTPALPANDHLILLLLSLILLAALRTTRIRSSGPTGNTYTLK